MSNTTTIMGRLGADPEVRFTSSGLKVTNLRVATSSRKGSNEETIWWRVTIWGDRFDKMVQYFKKGSAVVATGEITKKPELYTDRNGNPQVSSLELTAEILRFSPFGRPDENKEGASANGQENQGGFSSGQATANTEPTNSSSFSAAPAGDFSMNESSDLPF